MTSQQRADIYLSHWQNLWPLGAEERKKRFAEIVADYEYEDQLRAVTKELAEVAAC